MALQIKQNNGMLEIWGTLNAQNVHSLTKHLSLMRTLKEVLILSLDNLIGIDPVSTKILEHEYCNTAASNRVLTIIGRQNGTVLQAMKKTKTSYILSNDRV